MTRLNQISFKRRRKYFVDRDVQGAVLKQALLYWLWTTVVFGLVIAFCRIMPAWLSNSNEPWGKISFHLGPYSLASIVLFPIIIYCSIRFSNRFAGPMVRVRRALKALARGEGAEYLKFRDGDYWMDIADDINAISARMTEATESTPDPPAQQQQTPVVGAVVADAMPSDSSPAQPQA